MKAVPQFCAQQEHAHRPMNRSSTHAAAQTVKRKMWLHGRLRAWLIGATVVALAAWLFEFSTHLHLADADDAGAPSAVHLCGYCAAMQVGAGPVAAIVVIPRPSPEPAEPGADESFPSSSAATPYRSRAPPVA